MSSNFGLFLYSLSGFLFYRQATSMCTVSLGVVCAMCLPISSSVPCRIPLDFRHCCSPRPTHCLPLQARCCGFPLWHQNRPLSTLYHPLVSFSSFLTASGRIVRYIYGLTLK